jgi:hypothetical protein
MLFALERFAENKIKIRLFAQTCVITQQKNDFSDRNETFFTGILHNSAFFADNNVESQTIRLFCEAKRRFFNIHAI